MSKSITVLSVVASLALGLTSSCKKDETSKKDPAATRTAPVTKTDGPDKTDAPTVATPTDADAAAAMAVMVPYETCREALAADKADVSGCAQAIADAASKGVDGAAADSMKAIAAAATALAKEPVDDIEKLRLAFGDVSKPVQTMLTAIPAAAAKYKMYECPMAKGFKRWAQPMNGDKVAMANPYMGSKMLECGSEVHDHHMGASKDGDGKHGDGKHGDGKHSDGKHGDMKHGDGKHGDK